MVLTLPHYLVYRSSEERQAVDASLVVSPQRSQAAAVLTLFALLILALEVELALSCNFILERPMSPAQLLERSQ